MEREGAGPETEPIGDEAESAPRRCIRFFRPRHAARSLGVSENDPSVDDIGEKIKMATSPFQDIQP